MHGTCDYCGNAWTECACDSALSEAVKTLFRDDATPSDKLTAINTVSRLGGRFTPHWVAETFENAIFQKKKRRD